MQIFTIGYEGLDLEQFLELLLLHGVETLVDIRELPLSRKPGFSKKALTSALNLSGLEYLHMVDLGCPKPVRDQYRKDGSWKRYTEGFLRHLEIKRDAVEELAELATTSECALLCFEADYKFCHRSFVADAVQKSAGLRVKHIRASDARTLTSARAQSRTAGVGTRG